MRSHEIWHAEYLRLCEYAYEDWDNYFTEEQARHVAQGWADGNLNLDAWAEGFDRSPPTLSPKPRRSWTTSGCAHRTTGPTQTNPGAR